MITHRMRLRRRLVDTYMRVELQERGALLDERPDTSRERPAHPRVIPTSHRPLTVTKPETTRRVPPTS